MTNRPVSPCHHTKINQAAHAVERLYNAALLPFGIRITQFRMLRVVQRLAPVTVQALAQDLDLDRSTTGRNLRVLAKKGLVQLSSADHDARATVATLSEDGHRMLSKATPAWETCQHTIEHAIGSDTHERLANLVTRLTGDAIRANRPKATPAKH